jgi:hypothetical protein
VTAVPRDAIERVVGEAREQLSLEGVAIDLIES